MANNREITDLITASAQIFEEVIPQAAGNSYHDTTLLMSGLSQTCKPLNLFFKKPLADRMLLTLCQAVLDDHREQVINILNANPKLLWMQPSKEIIESKFTFQRFYVENPLIMAAKRKQDEMTRLILDWCDKSLPADEAKLAKAAASSARSMYTTQLNAEGEEEIVIPEDYVRFAKELIDVFSRETFHKGKLSKKTESTLRLLFNTLLPDEAVKLDDYLDIELFLLALYKGYVDHYNTFQNWNQRDAFCIRVIGLVQSVLSPETAKIFCEGLNDVVAARKKGKEIKLSDLALKHLLKDGTAFYRSSRLSQDGLGGTFLCGGHAGAGNWLACGLVRVLGFLMSSKNFKFAELMQPRPRNQSRSCVML